MELEKKYIYCVGVSFDFFIISFLNLIADSADELGRMGIIDILVNVIHNEDLNTEDKIKVTITLGHAIENSGDALNIYIDNFVHYRLQFRLQFNAGYFYIITQLSHR